MRPLTLLAALFFTVLATAQETPAPGHLVIVYRNAQIPADAAETLTRTGFRVTRTIPRFGIITLSNATPEIRTQLAEQPNVALVLQDRLVTAHALQFPLKPLPAGPDPIPTALPLIPRPMPVPVHRPILVPTSDADYDSAAGWAVLQSGGYGDNIPNTLALTTGPWNISKGAGTRIAILDSGVDATHPDIAPNLALNLSEINQIQLPSPCDDGTPQDQQGHGTSPPRSPPVQSAPAPASSPA